MSVPLTADAIAGLLPHRHPFLFLAYAEILSKTEARGMAVWPEDHPIFAGHFPAHPIVPAVCQVEAIAQLGGVLIGATARRNGEVPVASACGLLALIKAATFHAPVAPGQRLHMHCSVRRFSKEAFLVKAEGRLSGNLATRCDCVLAVKTVAGSSG